MSRSFFVDSLIGNNSTPSYSLPYCSSQIPNYMLNFFNFGLGVQHYQHQQHVMKLPVQTGSMSSPAIATAGLNISGSPLSISNPSSPMHNLNSEAGKTFSTL